MNDSTGTRALIPGCLALVLRSSDPRAPVGSCVRCLRVVDDDERERIDRSLRHIGAYLNPDLVWWAVDTGDEDRYTVNVCPAQDLMRIDGVVFKSADQVVYVKRPML